MCTRDMELLSYTVFFGSMMLSAIGITFLFYFKIYQTTKKSNLSIKIITGRKSHTEQYRQSHPCTVAIINELKLAKTCFKIFIIFITFCMPGVILTLMGIRDFVPDAVYLCAIFMGHTNSTLNFFIYYFDNQIFKSCIKNLIRRVMASNVSNHFK